MKPSWLILIGVLIFSLWMNLIDYVEGNFQWWDWENITHWEITIPMILLVVIINAVLDGRYEVMRRVKK